jgi:hypothetical protein
LAGTSVVAEAAECGQCELAKLRTRVIRGEGNPQAPILVLLNDREADVKALRGRGDEVNGLPTAVSYRSLSVRRRPALVRYFLEDSFLIFMCNAAADRRQKPPVFLFVIFL